MVRYFEFVEGKSSKFWEMDVDGSDCMVRYGRIGTDGQLSIKSFDSEDQAMAHMHKMVTQKIKKGYNEIVPELVS